MSPPPLHKNPAMMLIVVATITTPKMYAMSP